MRKAISSGSRLEADYAYSRAVVDGDWVFVAGTTGMDYATGDMPDDAAAQAEQAFRTIERILNEADASIEDTVRVQYTLTDAADLPALQPVMHRWLDTVRPAATAVIAGLVDPRMKIEIEVTVRKRATP